MKRLLYLFGLMALGCAHLQAQGRINFSNTSATPIRISNFCGVTNVLGTASTAMWGIGPASVRISLYAGLTSDTLSPVLVGTCACLPNVTNTSSALASAQGTFSGGNNLVLPFDGTQPVYLQMYLTSLNGNYAQLSPIIRVNLATNTQPSTAVFGAPASSNQWDGLTFGPLPAGPWFWAAPQSQTVLAGGDFTLDANAYGTGPLYYQWQHFSTNIPSATNASFSVTNVTAADAGGYRVVVTNGCSQSATSQVATITVGTPLQFLLQPAAQVVSLHGTASFSAIAAGNPAPAYQWHFSGGPIAGATATNLVIPNVGTNQLGNYSVMASNSSGAVSSEVVALYMSPSLQTPFAGTTAIWGKETTLRVGAVGSGTLAYQWYRDGQLLVDATNATLVFPAIQTTNGGFYTVVVSSAYGSVTNTPAQVVVNPAGVALGFYAGLTIEGIPGYTYRIESSTNLAAVNAWELRTNLTLVQPVELWLDSSVKALAPGNNGRHYRVSVEQP